MNESEDRVDWARIIAYLEREASVGMNSPGEWKLLAVLKHCLPRNFQRISRKGIIKLMFLLIFYVASSALGALIAVLQAWWTHGMRTAEIKKTETGARYSSSEETETMESKSREKYASSEKETKRDFKLYYGRSEDPSRLLRIQERISMQMAHRRPSTRSERGTNGETLWNVVRTILQWLLFPVAFGYCVLWLGCVMYFGQKLSSGSPLCFLWVVLMGCSFFLGLGLIGLLFGLAYD